MTQDLKTRIENATIETIVARADEIKNMFDTLVNPVPEDIFETEVCLIKAVDIIRSLEAKVAQQAETIRCMSVVFDDLAGELGVEPHNYGDPDFLFDAVYKLKLDSDTWKKATYQTQAKLAQLEERLNDK